LKVLVTIIIKRQKCIEHELLLPLLQQVAKGNNRAFEDLYGRTSAQLFAVALTMLKNKEQAEEALQEAYVRIWYKADYYKTGQGTVLTWMVSIVRYRALDMLRHKKVRKTHIDSEFDKIVTGDENIRDDEELSQDWLNQDKIHTCMDELSAQQRQAIHLAYFNGFSHSEVVSHLGSPLGSVKSWIKRGLDSLQRCLGL